MVSALSFFFVVVVGIEQLLTFLPHIRPAMTFNYFDLNVQRYLVMVGVTPSNVKICNHVQAVVQTLIISETLNHMNHALVILWSKALQQYINQQNDSSLKHTYPQTKKNNHTHTQTQTRLLLIRILTLMLCITIKKPFQTLFNIEILHVLAYLY